MQSPQAHRLANGRLHLHHGPIDLIIDAWGADKNRAFQAAEQRFQTVLSELVKDLDYLRRPLTKRRRVGPVARRMVKSVAPHSHVFVTPMAAVAGAVADDICQAMCQNLRLEKAYVNNGGDIAVFLAFDQQLVAAIHDGSDAGRVRFLAADPARGLATSGWQGRSHSLGIAEAVTVVARTAAAADVAATLIANAVDLPGHLAITRQAASVLSPDSDLGELLVTTGVGFLTRPEIRAALSGGKQTAQDMVDNGLIAAAALFLQGQNCTVGKAFSSGQTELSGKQNVRLHSA